MNGVIGCFFLFDWVVKLCVFSVALAVNIEGTFAVHM